MALPRAPSERRCPIHRADSHCGSRGHWKAARNGTDQAWNGSTVPAESLGGGFSLSDDQTPSQAGAERDREPEGKSSVAGW